MCQAYVNKTKKKNGCDDKICIIFSSLYYFYYMGFEWCYNYIFLYISVNMFMWIKMSFFKINNYKQMTNQVKKKSKTSKKKLCYKKKDGLLP